MSPRSTISTSTRARLRAVTQSLRLVDAKLRDNPEANRLFLEILTSKKNPEIALRRMNEAGVFGRFVPDFGRVVAQMQYDMYHVYTVDEHTLFAIGILHQIETGQLKEELPVASAIMPTVISRRALYVATLLHDIAKGRGGDHSETRREGRAEARAAARPIRRGDRDCRLAGALAPADEQHRLQARYRRPANHPDLYRSGAIARAPQAADWC